MTTQLEQDVTLAKELGGYKVTNAPTENAQRNAICRTNERG